MPTAQILEEALLSGRLTNPTNAELTQIVGEGTNFATRQRAADLLLKRAAANDLGVETEHLIAVVKRDWRDDAINQAALRALEHPLTPEQLLEIREAATNDTVLSIIADRQPQPISR